MTFPTETQVFDSPEKNFDLNSTLSGLGETPVKLHSLGSSSKRRKGQQKLISATATLKRKLETVYDVPLHSPETNLTSSDISHLQLFRNMWEETKEKFKNSEFYQERVQILTLSPFTTERTINEFETTNYLVKKSRAVKKENGILGLCDRKQGKALANELKEEILQFYESDENVECVQGKIVSIRNKDGDKIKHQKPLVFSNLCELYATWKEANPSKKVGFSTFAAQRPKF